jgi:hypothetical protein
MTKQLVWEVVVSLQEMDMSGGDNVDGPRWTGGFVEGDTSLVIVAPTKELAEAAAMTGFYEHQKAKVKKSKKLREVHAIVEVRSHE